MERDSRSGLMVPSRGRGAALSGLVMPEAVERKREPSDPFGHLAAKKTPARAGTRKRKKAVEPEAPRRPIHKCYAMDCRVTDEEKPLECITLNANLESGRVVPVRHWYACAEHYPLFRPPPRGFAVFEWDHWRVAGELKRMRERAAAPADMFNAGTHLAIQVPNPPRRAAGPTAPRATGKRKKKGRR
jgi:hypothetical protein